jgi:dTDP-4-amino-4,6-dideoxy-D-galactose acyltransferase
MAGDDPCDLLEWDSGFFGLRIARIAGGHLDEAAAERVLSWCEAHAVDCVYFLAVSDDAVTSRTAEDRGFRLVDIRVSLGRSLPRDAAAGPALPTSIRPFEAADLIELRAFARKNHRDSRFYFDPGFPEALCDALYETWIEKSCNGYADAVLVAEHDGRPAGYITCDLTAVGEGQIGLVGVGPEHRGRGIGRELVDGALGWFEARHASRVRVVTQARNVGAQRLYHRCGFLVESVELWYHHWLRRES